MNQMEKLRLYLKVYQIKSMKKMEKEYILCNQNKYLN